MPLTDLQVLALTGWGEARSVLTTFGWQPGASLNLIAVMCTVLNRLKADPARYGSTISAVCWQHAQYSCWTEGPGNDAALRAQIPAVEAGTVTDGQLLKCLTIARALIDGMDADVVDGATHYYAPLSMLPPGRIPTWAIGQTPIRILGGQQFFVGV
jgi:cell wall hydrolase